MADGPVFCATLYLNIVCTEKPYFGSPWLSASLLMKATMIDNDDDGVYISPVSFVTNKHAQDMWHTLWNN